MRAFDPSNARALRVLGAKENLLDLCERGGGDVREAIASHRPDEGGDGRVTLVIERPVNSTTPLAPRDVRAAGLEPLQDVVLRDLRAPAASGLDEQVSGAERGRRLLGLDDINDE